jgi:hypothetical protein
VCGSYIRGAHKEGAYQLYCLFRLLSTNLCRLFIYALYTLAFTIASACQLAASVQEGGILTAKMKDENPRHHRNIRYYCIASHHNVVSASTDGRRKTMAYV